MWCPVSEGRPNGKLGYQTVQMIATMAANRSPKHNAAFNSFKRVYSRVDDAKGKGPEPNRRTTLILAPASLLQQVRFNKFCQLGNIFKAWYCFSGVRSSMIKQPQEPSASTCIMARIN